MIIIETCPKCGGDLQDIQLYTDLPIPQKKCYKCGWLWTGEPQQILRVPFHEPEIIPMGDTQAVPENFAYPCGACSNNPKNGGSGMCNCILGAPKIT